MLLKSVTYNIRTLLCHHHHHHHHVHEGLGMFLDPQNVAGPSISSSVVLRSFVPFLHIVVLVLVVYLCPSSVRVVATFPGIVLFTLLYSVPGPRWHSG